MNYNSTEAQFIAQHMNELENDMRAAVERRDMGTATVLHRELKKLDRSRMRMTLAK